MPTLGVIDLPFLGVRVDSGAVADVDALEEGIIGMGDAFHRGGARMEAYLELTATMHRRAALPVCWRCVGAMGVARKRPDPGHALGPQQPVRRRRRACDRPRGGSDLHRLRRRSADSGVEGSHGGRPWHPARARQPRRRSCGGSAKQLKSVAIGRTSGTSGLSSTPKPRRRASPEI